MSLGIGILGFQGDVSEHIGVIRAIARKQKKEIRVTEIRKKEQLDQVSGLIIPGGESTTMYKLLNLYGIYAASIFEEPASDMTGALMKTALYSPIPEIFIS